MPASPLHSLLDPDVVSVMKASRNTSMEKRLMETTPEGMRSPSVSELTNDSDSKSSTDSSFLKSPTSVMMELTSLPPRLSCSVRFPSGNDATHYIPNDIVLASEMDDAEKAEIWWQQGDYYIFKKTSKMIASEMRRRQSLEVMPASYSSIMERTYSVCCQTAEESNNACPLSKKDLLFLERWKEHGISRRGLERWSFPKLAKERQRRKEIATRGVIELQNRFVRAMNLDGDTAAELIRKSSEQLTRSSRLFARALGEADAVAVASRPKWMEESF